jgi:hypothetical protein
LYRSFKDFYTQNWKKFVAYNIHDVRLVDKLEDKMKLDSELKKEEFKNKNTVENEKTNHGYEMEKQAAKGDIDFKSSKYVSDNSLAGTKYSSNNSLVIII